MGQKFLEGMESFPKQWKQIAELIGTRTALQVRTHAQKFFQSTNMVGNTNRKGQGSNGGQGSSGSMKGVGKTVRRRRAKGNKRKNSTTATACELDVQYATGDGAALHYYCPQSQPQRQETLQYTHTSAPQRSYSYPYGTDPTMVDCDRAWKRVKIVEATDTPPKTSVTLGACRAQDGVFSRNSVDVDAVSALLSLGARGCDLSSQSVSQSGVHYSLAI